MPSNSQGLSLTKKPFPNEHSVKARNAAEVRSAIANFTKELGKGVLIVIDRPFGGPLFFYENEVSRRRDSELFPETEANVVVSPIYSASIHATY